MLKIPKPVFFVTGMALGAVAVWYFFNPTAEPKKTVTKPVVRVSTPEVETSDTSLEKLNSILKRNEGESNYYSSNEVTIESYENIDKNSPLYDSLKKQLASENVTDNSSDNTQHIVYSDNNEVIKKDKLVGRETLKIISTQANTNTTDSVSSSMTGIHPKSTTSLEVEHWASPVHYKGYKLGRSRLLLFGTQPGAIKLLRHENELYLIFSQKVYWLQSSGGFSSLKPLPDKKLSASLLSYVD